ncbi:MAG: FAD:protein FMN transferase [Candidatus Paceibacterota bacterium]|jgi:thiamine biosynthesis lipoprotein
MKETRIIMGMPVTLDVVDKKINQEILDEVFEYFNYVDEKFSTYKDTSEISAINRGEINADGYSEDMKIIFDLSEETKKVTSGYFDIHKKDGSYDTSGMVKGWAIFNAAKILTNRGLENFYVEVAGDIQVSGHNSQGESWKIGIQNPFNKKQESVKTLHIQNGGVATSGTYVRGDHIYNPKNNDSTANDIVSMTVIGPNIYEADRFATASFAMGKEGIHFIESLEGFEGYMIDEKGIATMTSGFSVYTN